MRHKHPSRSLSHLLNCLLFVSLSFVPAPIILADPPGDDPVLVGAGDIARCGSRGAEATATLLDRIEGTIFTAGDNAYGDGTAEEFLACYGPTWGRHKERTRPSPGNHEYHSSGATPYYTYFGDKAGPAGRGYYSYSLGAWHIVSLNSNIGVEERSAQIRWLREDLAAHPTACTLAYWHHPLFSSGRHGGTPEVRALWRVLYEFGVDVVVNGHDHDYERFAPQTPDGDLDPVRGIRAFVVGTGGGELRPFSWWQLWPKTNSEIRDATSFGVLKFILHQASYEWAFLPVAGGVFHDEGRTECVR